MTAALGTQIRKEFRALAPWWAAIAATLLIGLLLQQLDLTRVAALRYEAFTIYAYALGAILLGALAFGHEYVNHTLQALLTLPLSRPQLLLAKLLPLVVLLLVLAMMLWVIIDGPRWGLGPRGTLVVWLPLLCGGFVAPMMTMISRGPLPGVVFTGVLPVGLFIVGNYFRVPYSAAWPIILALTACFAALTWRTFIRLEALGERHTEVDLLPWADRTDGLAAQGAVAHPLWMLLAKELRLQQLTFALAGIYTVLWSLCAVADHLDPGFLPPGTRYPLMTLYGVFVIVLAGALASAEERRYGTADAQILLPIAWRTQWFVKVGVVLTTALVLATLLPKLLAGMTPDPLLTEAFSPMLVVIASSAALYVSSLSRSGMYALLATAPAMVVAGGAVTLLTWVVPVVATPAIRALAEVIVPVLGIDTPDWRWRQIPVAAAWALGVGLLLTLAGANHRTADRSRARILRQCAWFAGLIVVAILAAILTEAIMLEWRRGALGGR